jgi:hypothetical protein
LYFFFLAIVLSVLLRYTDSDYPFGIRFKLFLYFPGWFTRLNDPSENYLPSTTLESVAGQDTEEVLVANSISCVCLTESGQGNKQTERKQISSGEILHVKRTDVAGSMTRLTNQSKYLV